MTSSVPPGQGPDPIVRGLVTVGAVIVLLIGRYIPLPGLGADFLERLRPGRLSIFGLGVTPIIFGGAIIELIRLVIPPLGRWAREPDNGALLNGLGRLLALAIAAYQARGVALALERMAGVANEPGLTFRIGIIATAVGATAFLIWLADLVTRRGAGDGLLILLAAPLVVRMPHIVALWIELTRTGAIPVDPSAAAAILTIIAVILLVAASLVHGRAPRLHARSGLAGANLDIWPPLLATTLFSPLGKLATALLRQEHPAALAGVQMIILAALIALFAGLRARAAGAQGNPSNLWPATLAQIVVCIGAMLFADIYQISSVNVGFWIVYIVAAVLSSFSRFVRL